jgi:hypothetical protein
MAAAIAAMWEQTVCAQTLCGFAAGFGVTRTRAQSREPSLFYLLNFR